MIRRNKKLILAGFPKRKPSDEVSKVINNTPTHLTGFVERVDEEKIEGWVIDSGHGGNFSVAFGEEEFPVAAERHERADVNAAHPSAPRKTGFTIRLSPNFFKDTVRYDLSQMELRYGSVPISRSNELHELITLRKAESTFKPLQVEKEVPSPIFPDESTSALNVAQDVKLVQCGLLLAVGSPMGQRLTSLEVKIKDERHSATLLPYDHGAEARIEIPPFIWDESDESGTCSLEVIASGERIGSIVVRAEAAIRFIENLEPQAWEDTAQTLLALEHARYLAKKIDFSPDLWNKLAEEAERFNCTDYVFQHARKRDIVGLSAGVPSQDDSSKCDLARLHIQTNVAQGAVLGPALFESAVMQFELSEQEQSRLALGLCEDFCRADRFFDIAYRPNAVHIDELKSSHDAWDVSRVIPFLVAQGEADEAASMLRRLPALTGWISTPSLLDASRRMAKDPGPIEKRYPFFYALTEYLDTMKGRYWSRLYDRDLARSLVPWLEKIHLFPDWLARDIIRAALRLFALSRDFWEALPNLERECAETARLASASEIFDRLMNLQVQPDSEKTLLFAMQAGSFLRNIGNSDGELLLREVALHIISNLKNNKELLNNAIATLESVGSTELLRVFAHPGELEVALFSRSEQVAELVRETLVRGSSQTTSSQYQLQRRLGHKLQQYASGPALCDAAASDVVEEALMFNNSGEGWLAADIIFRLVANLQPADPVRAGLMIHGEMALADALQSCSDIIAYPALHAAIARKNKLLSAQRAPQRRQRLRLEDADRIRKQNENDTLRQLYLSIAGSVNKLPAIEGWDDTLVVIYSCKKYLGDRIPRLRETWISDLKARGIPYVVLVGDGDDTLDGDILRLDVADTYEALPAKTLRMVDWVFKNTDYQYLVKIDDDCYFSADRFFSAMSYRKHHYYGRVLQKGKGGIRRDWHQAKSTSFSAKNRLDRSPEPCTYCDGGSGYSLSRHAMRKVVDAASTSAGRWLISVSYLEDKLIGDLLALESILPSGEDYFVHVMRRTHSEAAPVTMYESRFFPSDASPTSLVHLDRAEGMDEFHNLSKTGILSPKKIWPTTGSVELGYSKNQLEFIGSTAALLRLRSAEIVVVSVMRNEITMLPHFLAHYRSIGVTSFLIADNLSDDGSRELLQEQPDVALYSVESEYRHSHYGVAWQQALLANHCLGKWVVLVDADEFLTYPEVNSRPLSQITAVLDAEGYDCAGTILVDMYPKGALSDCDFLKEAPFAVASYHDDPPVDIVPGAGFYTNTRQQFTSTLRHRIAPGSARELFSANKYPLLRYAPWVRLSEGIHYTGNVRIAPDFLTLAHFKYHAGFSKKVDTEIARKQHFSGAIEYQRYRAMLSEARTSLYVSEISREIDIDMIPKKALVVDRKKGL